MTYVPDAEMARFIQEQSLAENIPADELIARALRNEKKRIYKKRMQDVFAEFDQFYPDLRKFDNIQSDEDIVQEAKETRRLLAEGKL